MKMTPLGHGLVVSISSSERPGSPVPLASTPPSREEQLPPRPVAESRTSPPCSGLAVPTRVSGSSWACCPHISVTGPHYIPCVPSPGTELRPGVCRILAQCSPKVHSQGRGGKGPRWGWAGNDSHPRGRKNHGSLASCMIGVHQRSAVLPKTERLWILCHLWENYENTPLTPISEKIILTLGNVVITYRMPAVPLGLEDQAQRKPGSHPAPCALHCGGPQASLH